MHSYAHRCATKLALVMLTIFLEYEYNNYCAHNIFIYQIKLNFIIIDNIDFFNTGKIKTYNKILHFANVIPGRLFFADCPFFIDT